MQSGKIIDLSMTIEEGMRVFPGIPEPAFTRTKTHDHNGIQATRLDMIVHAGTHADSPCHVIKDGKAISETSLDKLMGEGLVLNLKYKPPGSEITADDLKKCAGDIRKNDILIFNTGYENYSETDPYCVVAPDAAHWLVDHEIKCLAVDMLSLDPIHSTNGKASKKTHPSHHIILGAGIPLVESLINLDSLTKRRVFFCCLPLKISDSDAAPARAIAVEVESVTGQN